MGVWFTPEAIAAWRAGPRTGRGGQPRYSALAIATALTLRAVFRLALRRTEGLVASILALLGLDLAVPDHSTLSRRAETLAVPRPRRGREPGHLLVDGSVRARASGPVWPAAAPLVGTAGVGAWMDCVCCGSAGLTERPERTARGYRRFRCRDCGKQFNERSGGSLNRTQYPSDVVALVVLWRLRYRLTLRDLSEMSLHRGLVFSHEAVRAWEAKLAPVLADELRHRRRGRGGARGRHWHVDETLYLVGVSGRS